MADTKLPLAPGEQQPLRAADAEIESKAIARNGTRGNPLARNLDEA